MPCGSAAVAVLAVMGPLTLSAVLMGVRTGLAFFLLYLLLNTIPRCPA